LDDLTAYLRMASGCGTVFFYCRSKNPAWVGSFAQAARQAGRRLFTKEDCRDLDPAALANSPGKKVIFVLPSMMGFLNQYLDACPSNQRCLLLQARREGELCPMGFPFHDFWEERGVEIVSLYG